MSDLVGARLPAQRSQLAATIVATGPASLTVVDDSGEVTTRRAKEAATAEPLLSGMTVAERLVHAAFYWRLPEVASERILVEAVEAARGLDRDEQLRFARLAYAANRLDLVNWMSLPESARVWYQAMALLQDGRVAEAAEALLELPSGTYPARLAIWSLAASELVSTVREKVLGLLESFDNQDSAEQLAVAVTRLAVSAGGDVNADQAAALHDMLDEELITTHITKAREWSIDGVELLDALDDPETIAEKPALLAEAPTSLLDDLVDAQVLGPSSLDWQLPTRVANHLAARIDPRRLDDQALLSYDLPLERSRRAVAAGRPIPSDVPSDEAERLQLVADVLAGKVSPAGAGCLLHDEAERNELEQLLRDPQRLPSDRLLRSRVGALVWRKFALNTLPIDGLERAALSEVQQQAVGALALQRSRAALYDWRYDDAAQHAKACLRLCREESIRDEALNLIACAAWLQGEDEAAIRALETALDGEYTYALQANIGIVALELKPDVAGEHLAKLISEAPNLELRVAAARRTLGIWSAREVPDEQENDLPEHIALALRELLTQPIDGEDFRQLARLMADHDADWMAHFPKISCPHAKTSAAQLFAARASGMEAFVEALSQLLAASDPVEDWLLAERDGLVAAVRSGLLADEPLMGAAALAEIMLDKELPLELADAIVLRSLTARTVAMAVAEEEGSEPADRFLDRLIEDAGNLHRLEESEQERAEFVVQLAFNCLARAHLLGRWAQFQEIAHFHDRVLADKFGASRNRHNREIISRASQQIQGFADETIALCSRLRLHVDDEELQGAITELESKCNQMAVSARQNLRF